MGYFWRWQSFPLALLPKQKASSRKGQRWWQRIPSSVPWPTLCFSRQQGHMAEPNSVFGWVLMWGEGKASSMHRELREGSFLSRLTSYRGQGDRGCPGRLFTTLVICVGKSKWITKLPTEKIAHFCHSYKKRYKHNSFKRQIPLFLSLSLSVRRNLT